MFQKSALRGGGGGGGVVRHLQELASPGEAVPPASARPQISKYQIYTIKMAALYTVLTKVGYEVEHVTQAKPISTFHSSSPAIGSATDM